jgi:hypothetical protein
MFSIKTIFLYNQVSFNKGFNVFYFSLLCSLFTDTIARIRVALVLGLEVK